MLTLLLTWPLGGCTPIPPTPTLTQDPAPTKLIPRLTGANETEDLPVLSRGQASRQVQIGDGDFSAGGGPRKTGLHSCQDLSGQGWTQVRGPNVGGAYKGIRKWHCEMAASSSGPRAAGLLRLKTDWALP